LTGTNTTWGATPCVQVFDGSTTITLTNVNVSSPTLLTGTINIPMGATTGNYDAVVYDGASCSGPTDGTCSTCFTVNAAKVITDVDPDMGAQGETFSVSLSGMNTTWTGSPCVEISDGVTTMQLSSVNAPSNNFLSGILSIPSNANVSSNYGVTVYSGSSCSGPTDGTCSNCFTVAPLVDNINPASGTRGTSFSVTLTGLNTSFSGTPCVVVTDGTTTIQMTSVTVSSPTILDAVIDIPFLTPIGNYNVIVYPGSSCTGTPAALCSDCFLVSGPLPVEWLYFNAYSQEEVVDLAWATAAEERSSHFEVQRSADGVKWETIGTHAAQGSSNGAVEYGFEDKQPVQGTSYYRIRQVDLDGEFSFSETAVVNRIAKGFDFDVFPNPVEEGELNLRLQGADDSEVTVRLYDVSRQLILELTKEQLNDQNILLNLPDLSAGLYFVTLTQGKHHLTKQFIKL
ncbi:MAG: T9SS type A sorting domain-containing protein, partial [Bacteroidota bacterium]